MSNHISKFSICLGAVGIFLVVCFWVITNLSLSRRSAVAEFDWKHNQIVGWSWHPQFSKLFDEDKLEISETISGLDFGYRSFKKEIVVKQRLGNEGDMPDNPRIRFTVSISLGDFSDSTLPEYQFHVGPILQDRIISHEEFNQLLTTNSMPKFSPIASREITHR